MRLKQVTLPAAEPLHLTEAKLHLRLAVDAAGAELYTAEDSMISSWITAARQIAETETWKAMVYQAWDLFLDEWPDEIQLEFPPLRKVEFVKYTNTDGVTTTLPTTEYEVDTNSPRGRVVLAYNKSWPGGELAPVNPIQIRFRCGYLVPVVVNSTTDILNATGHPFVNGEVVRLSVSGGALPGALAAMTSYYVIDATADTFKLSTAAGGSPINITSNGTGTIFIGEIPATTIAGMKLIISDFYSNRGEAVIVPLSLIPMAASRLFAMDSDRGF